MLETINGIFRFFSLLKWGLKDRGSWQPNTHARAKDTRVKAGKSKKKWCRTFVQILTTYFLKRL